MLDEISLAISQFSTIRITTCHTAIITLQFLVLESHYIAPCGPELSRESDSVSSVANY